MTLRRTLTLAGALLAPVALAAQSPGRSASRVSKNAIEGDLRFLSSDLLEGRAPATRGGELATEYIAEQLRSAGIRPGVNGSYFQPVPIDVVTADSSSIRVAASGKANAVLSYPGDVVVWAGSAVPRSKARGELVFVGYGATAPEYHWDDFKGVDVKGKVLLVLVNDPPAPRNDPKLFGGKAMTYYGRWTYKFEEAERRGAAGMLIIHTTAEASYPWHTVVGSWTTPQRMLPRDSTLPAPLGFRGWITDSAATLLLKQAGLDLARLRKQAASRDFRPVPTGITMDVSIRSSVQHLQSRNVVGVLPGSSGKLGNEYVAYSAHWDHFGIGPKVNGDSIYNGAEDNASGVATLLAVARAQAAAPRPRRSQLFVFVTAEEAGLLGSDWFARNPTVPAPNIIADLNLDVVTVHGRVRDLNVLGDDKSSLGPMLAHLVARDGMRITPDAHPEAGHFYRSDHFSFAKVGIPAVSIGAGTDYVGRPKGWGVKVEDDYTAHRYHQPSDEYRSSFDLSGAAQIGDIVSRFGTALANSPVVPKWNADAEFKAAREKSRKPVSE
ncbi:MAG TPA: M28 family peptidase [Gemmatimonadaceae bacterium]|nr:M28 family peptidase [Gemmatimonadaceae bacterium]